MLYTDGSKENEGAGVYGHGMRPGISFGLGQYTTVFQAVAHAMKACAVENIKKDVRKATFIFSLIVKQ
jgi:hypothetical protein